MGRLTVPKAEEKKIDKLVKLYSDNLDAFNHFANIVYTRLQSDKELTKYVHSIKHRVKDPVHLKDKLTRKFLDYKTKGDKCDINETNLFEKITDLAGVRLIHLHTKQMGNIDPIMKGIFKQDRFELIEGPIANTWDVETSDYFKSLSIEVKSRTSLYTSVHYVIVSTSKARERCEVQVRTLSEELWGETDHKINYPHKTTSICCAEQLRTLARLASSCTRLVDSIFAAHEEHTKKK